MIIMSWKSEVVLSKFENGKTPELLTRNIINKIIMRLIKASLL